VPLIYSTHKYGGTRESVTAFKWSATMDSRVRSGIAAAMKSLKS
jgi:hypothetical protein